MILRAKYLITGDGRTCLQDQAVYLDKEGKIGWIGDAAEAAGRYPEEMVKDYGEATILDTKTPLSFVCYWVVPFSLLGAAALASRFLPDRMLAGIEDVIHTEVRKLYPDAELPAFEIACHTPERLELLYQSPRCLSRLAHGLIDGALQHYGEQAAVRLEPLEPSGQRVRIVLERSA